MANNTYTLTDSERAFLLGARAAVIQAAAAVRGAQVALVAAETEEARIKNQFEGAVKMLMNAHDLRTAKLSSDCSQLVIA
jgi:hypothetical protein